MKFLLTGGRKTAIKNGSICLFFQAGYIELFVCSVGTEIPRIIKRRDYFVSGYNKKCIPKFKHRK